MAISKFASNTSLGDWLFFFFKQTPLKKSLIFIYVPHQRQVNNKLHKFPTKGNLIKRGTLGLCACGGLMYAWSCRGFVVYMLYQTK